MSAAVQRALQAQAEAANPRASAFVSANAGSGKTHVLINRVIRLLLEQAAHGGARPQNILCITFTKAAAAEMLDRLFERLGAYSIMKDNALLEELKELKASTGPENLHQVRALFAQALETPGGLKIRTIHSFCESLLRRFPLEAGISAGFQVLDEGRAEDLRRQALAEIGARVADNPGGTLDQALHIAMAVSADGLDNLSAFVTANGRRIAAFVARCGGLEGATADTAKTLGIPPELTPEAALEAAMAGLDRAVLKRIGDALAEGSPKDVASAEHVFAALQEEDKAQAFAHVQQAFFTQAMERRKKFPTKATVVKYPALPELIAELQESVETAAARINAARVLRNSAAALVLAEAFWRRYARLKAGQGALDYDDLIDNSLALLRDSQAAAWVLYKLDYDLEHILVDEAQDNSARQWQIVRALSGDFFSGKSAREALERTLFAVGDPKQSIYSFQGAEPALFAREASHYQKSVRDAHGRFARPDLALSWRSCRQILQMVDKTFTPLEQKVVSAAPETRFAGALKDVPQSPGFDHYVPHAAQREKAEGCVELWAPVPRPDNLEPDDPGVPLDAPKQDSAEARLASQIAARIGRWLRRGELVSVRTQRGWQRRAMQAGDILILVRTRGALFNEIIRQLKGHAIAVAGADRMALGEQAAVLDLMSAARAALSQDEDLALAEFLRGPFLQPAVCKSAIIDEQALYELAALRPPGQSLWQALCASTAPHLQEARNLMSALRDSARRDTPFAFFAGLLYRQSDTGESYARRLYARLGRESEDPVREFLSKAQSFAGDEAPSLTGFASRQMADESIIKREMQSVGDAVRVLTVHGAKGLEAPVVILPDTTGGPPGGRDSGLMFGEDGALYWSPRKGGDPLVCTKIRDRAAQRAMQEYRRLLYVAMTRAQDRLVICGAQKGKAKALVAAASWHAWCAGAFDALAQEHTLHDFHVGTSLQARRFGPAPSCATHSAQGAAPLCADAVPTWAGAPFEAALPDGGAMAPSHWLEDSAARSAVLSPLADGGVQRYRRGLLIHTLLQTLPELLPERQHQAAEDYLCAQGELDAAHIEEICKAVFGVLHAPDFAPLFGPASRAEVALGGGVELGGRARRMAGQIDRLVVTDTTVLVVDYKTNRPAPERAEDVPGAYLRQMAAYRALLRAMWPDREVRCALLWTDIPVLMSLKDSLLDRAVQAVYLDETPAGH